MATSAPRHLLKTFYDKFKRDLGKASFEEWASHVSKNLGKKDIEKMADMLHAKKYSHIPREEFDTKTGLQKWRENQPGWISNVGRGMGETAADLAGGFARGVGAAQDVVMGAAEKAGIPTPFSYDEKGEYDPDRIAKAGGVQKGESIFKSDAETLENVDLGYKVGTSWEDFKDQPVKNFFPFAMEHGLISAPHMAAMMASLPTYMFARSGQLGQERALNDLRDDATFDDVIKAAPAAVVSAVLDKMALKGILGIPGKSKGKAKIPESPGARLSSNTAKGVAGATGKAALELKPERKRCRKVSSILAQE